MNDKDNLCSHIYIYNIEDYLEATKMNNKKNQTVLDFGQKSLGLKHCNDCGMLFNLDDKDDAELHQKYHKQKDNILKFNGWKNEKIVQEYLDGARCLVIESNIDTKIALKKAHDILKYVDTQLGIRNTNQMALAEIDYDANTKSHNSTTCKYYLYVYSNRVVGFCATEEITKAYKVKYIESNIKSLDARTGMSRALLTCDQDVSVPAMCGISRIWVDKDHRRNKIATKLLDCVRKNFAYFKILNLDEIAFSDPTEFGKLLAKTYFNTSEFLVYFDEKQTNK